MKRTLFEDLCRRHHAEGFRYFHQRRLWRPLREPGRESAGLCAALIEMWWGALVKGDSLLERLTEPTPALLRQLTETQRRSRHLHALEGVAATDLNAKDRELLKHKYGSADPDLIRTRLAHRGAADFLELDLMTSFHCRIASRSHLDREGVDPGSWRMDDGPGAWLMLAVLRYTKPKGAGAVQSGHRLALARLTPHRLVFFDPNCGQVIFRDAASCQAWLADFWQAAIYRHRLPPRQDLHYLTLFQLRPL